MRVKIKRVRKAKPYVKGRPVDRAQDEVKSGHRHARAAREIGDTDSLPAIHKDFGQESAVGVIGGSAGGEDQGGVAQGKRRRHRVQFTTPAVNGGGAWGARPGEVGAMVPTHWRLRSGFSMLRGLDERSPWDKTYEG